MVTYHDRHSIDELQVFGVSDHVSFVAKPYDEKGEPIGDFEITLDRDTVQALVGQLTSWLDRTSGE